MTKEDMITSLVAGAAAGMTCDIALYPLDTVKTRLQSKSGFLKSGGFRGIYRGLRSAAIGSVPAASVFFLAYDTSKFLLPSVLSSDISVHMTSGCIGETFACMARIPFEVVKQTAQTNSGFTSRTALYHVISRNGIGGLFRGYFSLVFRDIPFAIIQMPIWEFLKSNVAKYYNKEISSFQSGACGSVAGGITAAITTPLDVAKTRIILSQRCSGYSENPFRVIIQITKEEGMAKLFSGVTPRVAWLSCGGFIFFGAYEFAKKNLCGFLLRE